MKAIIRKIEMFSFEIGDTTHVNFEKTETWKGMACYKNSVGEIITADYPDNSPLDWVFNLVDDSSKTDGQHVIIISASPCFLGELSEQKPCK